MAWLPRRSPLLCTDLHPKLEISRVAAVRVAFLTGYVGSAEVHARIDRAIADGACGCRPKPATSADIRSLLEAASLQSDG